MASNNTLLDGQFARGIYVGRTPIEYPFQINGDRTAAILTRDFRVRESTYVPGQIGVERDPTWPAAYLMSEGAPLPTGLADVLTMRRTFATVPADQITYGSRVITKPTVASVGGTAVGSMWEGVANLTSYSSILYSNHIFGGNNKVYGPRMASTSATSGGNTRVTATAHGIAGTETLLTTGSDNSSTQYAILAPANYSVVDANTIDILGVNWNANVITVSKYLRDYASGTDRVGTRLTQKFYLPGVTSGITTAADIPLPALLANDAALIAAVIASATGYQTYDASALGRWRDWPIYTQTLEEINMADL